MLFNIKINSYLRFSLDSILLNGQGDVFLNSSPFFIAKDFKINIIKMRIPFSININVVKKKVVFSVHRLFFIDKILKSNIIKIEDNFFLYFKRWCYSCCITFFLWSKI
tara:strand:- start:10 stop:333 length:324 start_codon:yes stop_codon:yes gene_type:complete